MSTSFLRITFITFIRLSMPNLARALHAFLPLSHASNELSLGTLNTTILFVGPSFIRISYKSLLYNIPVRAILNLDIVGFPALKVGHVSHKNVLTKFITRLESQETLKHFNLVY